MYKRIISISFSLLIIVNICIGVTAESFSEKNSSTNCQYKEIKPILVKTDNKLIISLMKNNWAENQIKTLLGKDDGFIVGYEQFFKAGINVKVMNGKVFNLVFNKNYTKNILYNIGLSSKKTDIIHILGTPQFNDRSSELFGYKTQNFYIFFNGKEVIEEISVYRRDTKYNEESLAEALINTVIISHRSTSSFALNNATNKILKSWTDFDYKGYDDKDSGGIENINYALRILYYSRGINVINGDNGEIRVRIYGNYIGRIGKEVRLPDNIGRLNHLNNKDILLELDKDSIFEFEKDRVKEKTKGILSPDKSMKAYVNDINGSDLAYNVVFILDLNKSKPDISLTPSTKAVTWINNRYLSGVLDGEYPPNEEKCNANYWVYIYDIFKSKMNYVRIPANGALKTQIEDISVRNNEIICVDYDKKVYSIKYSFNKSGEIIFC